MINNVCFQLQTFSLHRSHSDKTSDESSTDNLKLVGVRNFLQRVIESDAQKKRGDTSSMFGLLKIRST